METTEKNKSTTMKIDAKIAREVKIMAVLKDVKVQTYAEEALREKLQKDRNEKKEH